MPNVKVANPAAHLLVVNGGHKMKKRRNSTNTKRRTVATKPSATTQTKKRRNPSFAVRRRKPNPALSVSNLIELAIYGAGGAIITDTLVNLLPIAGQGTLVNAAIKTGVAYAVGVGSNKFLGVSPAHANMIAAGGVVAVAKDLMNEYVLPTVQGVLTPKPQPQVKAVPAPTKAGVGDIATLRPGAYDPFYGSTPRIGMGDLVTMRQPAV